MAQMSSVGHTPVVIVGAGPVGLALAGDLGWRGIRCILIEKGDGQVFQPRMDMVGIRTMESAGAGAWSARSKARPTRATMRRTTSI